MTEEEISEERLSNDWSCESCECPVFLDSCGVTLSCFLLRACGLETFLTLAEDLAASCGAASFLFWPRLTVVEAVKLGGGIGGANV